MHLVAAGLDVIGVTIPSVPFVVLGHNQRIAWGITNTNADVQDIAIERVDVGGKRAMYARLVGAGPGCPGRHSGAGPERAGPLRDLEDAQRIDLRRRRGARLGSAADVAVAPGARL